MNEDRLLLEMRNWLQEEQVALPDAERASQQIASQLPATRQRRRRWWRLPVRARMPKPLRTADTAETHPTPIPASNGHTPTVIGRTTSMLRPVKALTAGALGVALGGAVRVAQPCGQRDATVPGAEADVEATWVTGTVRFASSCVEPERTTQAGLTIERGYVCEPQTWESDDPRLGGTATASWNADVYWFPTERYSVINAFWDIRDETGGWTCRSGGLDRGSGLFTDPVAGAGELTCAGYGDNEGLTAILVADWSTSRSFEGLIFDREVPPEPDLPAE